MTDSVLRVSTSQRAWIMLALMIGVFLSPLNVNFTSVALPTMRDYFAISVEQVTWVGTAYFIPTVVLMPLAVAISSRWGLRRTYVLGLLILSGGAFLSAAAPNFRWLLVGRAIQGAGWSALYPIALVLIRRLFAAEKQGEVMGLYESSVGVATIIGPLLAGFLVEFLGWPSVYIAMGVLALAGGLTAMAAVPSFEQQEELRKFDWKGAFLFTGTLAFILLGLTRKSPALLLAGAGGAIIWIVAALRREDPFISPLVFKNRRFTSASMAATIRMLVAVSVLTALPLLFEDIQGLNPSRVGTIMVIYSVLLFFGSWPGGRWADRAGAHIPGLVGYIAMIAGVALLLGLGVQLSLLIVVPALAIRGFGAGLTQAPFAKVATNALPGQSGMAAGLYGTLRYGGLALGTAMTGILLDSRLRHYGASHGDPAALAAYRELWLVLILLSTVGMGLTWFMSRSPAESSA